ncbi:hypothetical protein [Synechococcus sp. PCC 6312]|uniref:hypothetical protein n=1 Tax=Synechococcus sp. (strain ATCC 27167 / PCC 6312) TaxID=195253 RepID=UPI00029F3757|nr:hypothetical protein [Synechococcus sp. PCC 6312]AFY60348.1 hypothetical protein Syn6312_1162 [Synechococcus sp. PCC 6312]
MPSLETSLPPDWVFIETWVDATSRIPYVLMVVADQKGNYKIYDPKENYKSILESNRYEDVEEFLLEDEYDLVGKRFSDQVLTPPQLAA